MATWSLVEELSEEERTRIREREQWRVKQRQEGVVARAREMVGYTSWETFRTHLPVRDILESRSELLQESEELSCDSTTQTTKNKAKTFVDKFVAKSRLGARLMALGSLEPDDLVNRDLAKLIWAGEDEDAAWPYIKKLGHRMRCCRLKTPHKVGVPVMGGTCENGHKHVDGPYRCRSPWCDLCRSDRAEDNRRSLTRIVNEAYVRIDRDFELIHVTLTVRHDRSSLAGERRKHLQKSFHKLVNRVFWKHRVLGCAKNVECHIKGKGPHAHLHILAAVERSNERQQNLKYLQALSWKSLISLAKTYSWWRQIPRVIRTAKRPTRTQRKELMNALNQAHWGLPQQVLSWEWKAVSKDSWMVKCVDKSGDASSINRAISEVCKYVSKGDLADPDRITDAQLIEMVAAFRNVRVFDYHGLFRVIAKELGEDEVGQVEEGGEEKEQSNVCKCPDCGAETKMQPILNAEAWLMGYAPPDWADEYFWWGELPPKEESKPPDIPPEKEEADNARFRQETLPFQ